MIPFVFEFDYLCLLICWAFGCWVAVWWVYHFNLGFGFARFTLLLAGCFGLVAFVDLLYFVALFELLGYASPVGFVWVSDWFELLVLIILIICF